MSWLVDNAATLFIVIGMVALAFAAAWWVNRKRAYAIGAALALGAFALIWLLTQVITTDRQQLAINVHAMADAVVSGKPETLLKLWTADFEFQGRQAPELAQAAVKAAKQYHVSEIKITGFDVEEINATTARVYFHATAFARGDDRPYMVGCRGSFIKQGKSWQLKQVRFFNPVVDEKMEINLPLP